MKYLSRNISVWIAAALVIVGLVVGWFNGWYLPALVKGATRVANQYGKYESPDSKEGLATKNSGAAANTNKLTASAASAQLPPPGTPLKQILTDLKSRAYAGDPVAASRLYNDLGSCARVRHLSRTVRAISAQSLSDTRTLDSSVAAQNANSNLDRIQRSLDFINRNTSLCEGIDDEDAAMLVPVTLQAARLGDTKAANCYVAADLNSWFQSGLADNPQWITDYKANALDIATIAVQHGDWTMVNLLGWANRGGFSSHDLLPQITGQNPVQAYTYEKLMALGRPVSAANDAFVTDYLANFIQQLKLNANEVRMADAQAQDMYERYFSSTPAQGNLDALRTCRMDAY